VSPDPSPQPRALVADSWQRSLRARVDPDRSAAPQIHAEDDVSQLRREHPLASAIPALRETMLRGRPDHVLVVTDEHGDVLWREGTTSVLRDADRIGLLEGTRWTEECIGTNAMGTALATSAPVQIHAGEHLIHRFDRWTCAAAPIHDPASGRVIGTVDITGPLKCYHRSTLALVSTAARLAEALVRPYRDECTIELALLGPAPPTIRLRGRRVELTARQADLLAVLALNPHGVGGDELATTVYGETGRTATVRAEIHRLRRRLGTDLVSAQPYRLRGSVRADFLLVQEALTRGEVARAASLYHGPLLPCSEAPIVRDERFWLGASIRRAVTDSADPEALWAFAQTSEGVDDKEVAALLSHHLPKGDPRHCVLRCDRAEVLR
jgi:hypothetical protein